MKQPVTGRVLYGINTIYTVLAENAEIQCRIKGKVLRSAERLYNPIAAGDVVEVEPDPLTPSHGMIASVHERRTILSRWNKKGRARQILAANADIAACVTSPQSPPFRPRFIDRVIAAAESGGMSVVIVMNKSDLGMDRDTEERLSDFRRIGYPVHLCSARTGDGVDGLRAVFAEKSAVFIGQSGVGKSSVLNSLQPGLGLRTGEVSAKYDRGSHTTNFSMLIRLPDGTSIIDTPGIRELELADVLPEELAYSFRDFTPFSAQCEVPVCPHDDEPGCAVRAAVERGELHRDRYESYIRMLSELREKRRSAHG